MRFSSGFLVSYKGVKNKKKNPSLRSRWKMPTPAKGTPGLCSVTHTHKLMQAHTWVKTSAERCRLAKASRERGPGFLFFFFFFFFLSVPFVKLLQVLQCRRCFIVSKSVCITNTDRKVHVLEGTSFISYLEPLRVALVGLHPLIVISCKDLSISLLAGSLELGGAGGSRILNPNKCFFFFTSFPDINLEE